jgi:hypothetical protein
MVDTSAVRLASGAGEMIEFFQKHYKVIIWIMIGTFLMGLLPTIFIR